MNLETMKARLTHLAVLTALATASVGADLLGWLGFHDGGWWC